MTWPNLSNFLVGVLLLSAACAPSPNDKPARSASSPQMRPELALPRTAEYDYDVPEPGSYQLPVIQLAADGEVLAEHSKPRHLRELFRDRVTVLSFIYTRCGDPKACPRATGVLYQLHQLTMRDPALADNLRLLTFSFDPDHDTPQVMANYGQGFQSQERSADWQFLTTRSTQQLAPILQTYGQRVDRKKDPSDPSGPLYHNLRVFLIDQQGRIRNIYSQNLLDPRLLMADIRSLLMQRTN